MPDLKWIFDTVAFSNFCLSNSVFLIESRYRKRCFMTWQFYYELSSGFNDYPELKQIDKLIEAKDLGLLSLTKAEHNHYRQLIGHLGKGEASCIAVAKEQKATVVTDDRAARSQCSLMSIPCTGTIGILKASLLDKQISLTQADDILNKMINAGFYSPVRNISDIV